MLKFGLQDDTNVIILDIFKSYPQIEEVILFGSRALNTFKAASDIDFAIKGKSTRSILATLMDDFEESDLIYEVDVVDYASISTEKLLEHIDRHGKVFYRKGWVETSIGEVTCYASSKIPVSEVDLDSYISTENLLPDKLGVTQAATIPKVSNVNAFTAGDTLFSNIRTYFKKVWYSDKSGGVSNDVLVFRPVDEEQLDKKYLYYLISNDGFIDYTVTTAKGTKMPRGDKDAIKQYPLSLPPLPEQKAIADMLSSFDEKIELLREQNKTLEALAQTIFKEWFVNFNYPDATDEMIDSELGEIPKDWQIKTIDKLVDLIIDYRGKTPKKLGMDWSDSGISALSAKTIKNGKIVRRDAMNLGSKKLYDIWMKDELERKDILLTSEAPLGEMYYLSDDTKYILSQRLFALRTNKEITSEYLYHYLFSPLGQYLLKSRASGSTVEGIRQSELRKVEVIVPDKEVMKKASDTFASVFEKTALNDQEIQTLTKTRDTLLPKLMLGDVRV